MARDEKSVGDQRAASERGEEEGEGGKEIETERERDTHTHTQRERERQRDRETVKGQSLDVYFRQSIKCAFCSRGKEMGRLR